MIRKIIISILCAFSLSSVCFAATDVVSQYLPAAQVGTTTCNKASISSAPDFCATFPPVATCNCLAHSAPPTVCNTPSKIYTLMIQTYGSIWGACSTSVQHETTQQECYDDWMCYMNGGTSSTGKCNATGLACPK